MSPCTAQNQCKRWCRHRHSPQGNSLFVRSLFHNSKESKEIPSSSVVSAAVRGSWAYVSFISHTACVYQKLILRQKQAPYSSPPGISAQELCWLGTALYKFKNKEANNKKVKQLAPYHTGMERGFQHNYERPRQWPCPPVLLLPPPTKALIQRMREKKNVSWDFPNKNVPFFSAKVTWESGNFPLPVL